MNPVGSQGQTLMFKYLDLRNVLLLKSQMIVSNQPFNILEQSRWKDNTLHKYYIHTCALSGPFSASPWCYIGRLWSPGLGISSGCALGALLIRLLVFLSPLL